ncbi:MAG: tyrosine-type recombinase/integrase family protein, partial [Myxococcales bacterium]|nr:tyrosine-type recombinase/integrase family protein [Myxococcales bacterium]
MLTFPGRPKFRERRKAPVRTKSAAKRWGEERERQIIQHFSNTDPSEDSEDDRPDLVKKEVPTLREFVPRYMEGYCKANRHRPSTMERKRSSIRVHLIPKLGHRRLDRITAEDIQQLKASMSDMKANSANNIITLLKAILNVAVEWKVIPELPVKIKKLRESERELVFYDFDDYARLVAAAKAIGSRVHLVALLGGDAGLRRGEIIGLEWSDIDLVHG